jgi:uncharacterized protein DUF4157
VKAHAPLAEPAKAPARALLARGARRPLRFKLAVGPVNDPLEHEADRVARRVLRRSPGAGPARCACGGTPGPDGLCAACRARLARAAAGPAPASAPPSVDAALARPGAALDGPTRAFFEPRLGVGLGGVRVHDDPVAHASAADVAAHAYTVGRDVVFAAGRYRPASQSGRELLAHELAHVAQQGDGVLRRRPAGPREGLTLVEPMDQAEALLVIADDLGRAPDTSRAALISLEATLRMPLSTENAALRVRRLSAAVSLLDAADAALVIAALTRPANSRQKELRGLFMRLDHRTREPLLAMLDDRAQRTAEAPAKAEPVAPKAEPRRWAKVDEGVFAYIAPAGATIDAVADHISGYAELAKILSELNGVERKKPLPKATPIIVPAEYISRPEALAEVPEALRAEIADTQRARGDAAAFQRFVKVQSGHPAGPGAVGLAPVTLAPVIRPGLWDALKYGAGFVWGLIAGAWDAVEDLFTGAWAMIKAVGTAIYNLLTANLGAIVRTVKGWIAQLELLWARRAEIAADFMGKWNAKDPWDRGRFRGGVIGWVMMTVLLVIVTWGEGAVAQISGKWANVVKVLNIAQKAGDLATYTSAFAKIADKTVQLAIDALKASRFAKVVEVGAIVAKPIEWTAKGLRAVWALPGRMAEGLTDKIAEGLRVLEPYTEKIKNLSARAKRWLFGCHSPCDWNPEFALRQLERGEDIEARALRELGEEDWDIEELADVGETPVKAEPRARGHAIEDRRILMVEQEGFERLPDWFKTHDAYRGGTVTKKIEKGREIRVITRPDTLSIKSTWITDPTRLTATVEDYFATLRGRFGHTRGGVRIVGASSRTLDLIFEEGTSLTPDALRALEQLKQSAGSIRFRWYVMQSDRIVPSAQYLRALRVGP